MDLRYDEEINSSNWAQLIIKLSLFDFYYLGSQIMLSTNNTEFGMISLEKSRMSFSDEIVVVVLVWSKFAEPEAAQVL